MTTDSSRLTIGIIGCGSLGTAILKGLLSGGSRKSSSSPIRLGKIVATVTSEKSAKSLQESLPDQSDVKVQVVRGQNEVAVHNSDLIILATPPDSVVAVLGTLGMGSALRGKVLVSVLAGVTRLQIESAIHGQVVGRVSTRDRCWVFRSMLNLAAAVGASASVIETPDSSIPREKTKLVDDVFSLFGDVVHTPASAMNACTALCGSTPAFIALFVDALVDGAVAGGVPRAQAQAVAIQTLVSTSTLLQQGQSPAELREAVCAMPGCTIQGILGLEQGGARGVIAKTMFDTIVAASKLGQKKDE